MPRDVATKLLAAAVKAQNEGVLAEVEPADLLLLIDGLSRVHDQVVIADLTERLRVVEGAASKYLDLTRGIPPHPNLLNAQEALSEALSEALDDLHVLAVKPSV